MKKSIFIWCLGMFIVWSVEGAVNFLGSSFNPYGYQVLVIAFLYMLLGVIGAFIDLRIQRLILKIKKTEVNAIAFSSSLVICFSLASYLYLWLNDKNPATLFARSAIIMDLILLGVCIALFFILYKVFSKFKKSIDITAVYAALCASLFFIISYLPDFNWDIYHESVWSMERFLTWHTIKLNLFVIFGAAAGCFLIYKFRKLFYALLACFFVLFTGYNIFGSFSSKSIERGLNSSPNVIIYLMDALRADHLSCYGYRRDTTPNIDEFSRSASLFENCITPNPITQLVIPSILTSRYNSLKARKNFNFMNSLVRLQEILGSHGYLTASFTGFYFSQRIPGLDKGFDYQYSPYGAYYEFFIPKFYLTFLNAFTSDKYSWGVPFEKMEKGLFGWLKKNKNKHFFAYIHSTDTHAPYWVNSDYKRKFFKGNEEDKYKVSEKWRILQNKIGRDNIGDVIDVYDDAINSSDINFGKLIKKLKELNLYDNTIIIVMADHGEGLLDHNNAHHGRSSFEEEIHVPLIIRYTGIFEGGVKLPDLVSSMDIMPSIVGLCGITSSAKFDGRSFIPIIRKSPGEKFRVHREYVFTEKDGSFTSIRTNRFKLTICDAQKKYLLGTNSLAHNKLKELYDLQADPGELNNIYDLVKDKEVEKLEEILVKHIRFMRNLGQEE